MSDTYVPNDACTTYGCDAGCDKGVDTYPRVGAAAVKVPAVVLFIQD